MAISVQSLVNELGSRKGEFLKNVRDNVYEHIAVKNWRDCLTITDLYYDGSVRSTYRPEASTDYGGRLIAFTRGKKYDDRVLDSGLTPGVVKTVIEEFEKFYASETFSKMLVKQLMSDRVFAKKLAETIVDAASGPISAALKRQITERLADILQERLGDTLVNATVALVSQVVAVIVSKSVLTIILHQMVIMLKGALAKILATTALKTTLVAAIKKLATIKIVAFVTALVAPALGSVPVFFIAAPIIAVVLAWIINHEAENLPKNMATKISVAIRDELDRKFDDINNDIVTELVNSLTTDALGKLAENVAHDLATNDEFRAALRQLGNQ